MADGIEPLRIVDLGMTYIDLLILVPLLWGAVRGFMKGFIISISGLLALILGIYGAVLLSDRLGAYLAESHGLEGAMMPTIAFSLVFLAIVVGVYFLGRLIQKGMSLVALGFVNKLAGGLFGVLKSALVLSVVILLLQMADAHFPFLPKKELEKSFLYEPVADLTQEYFPRIADSKAFEQLKTVTNEARQDLEKSLE